MYDILHQVIYVGKAKDLKKRLASYFRCRLDSPKTRALVAQIASIDITVTHTEAEALVLEQNYIKCYQPRYNILLRDDKSYPYILLSDHRYPRIALYRGARRGKHEYFGPYPNGGAARDSMQLIQKLFRLRPCLDTVFSNRSRPCLLHQLGRCSAPCVERVSVAEYEAQLQLARLFLLGRSQAVIDQLVTVMQKASDELRFEEAARFRDQIHSLRQIQQQQSVDGCGHEAMDVIGVASAEGEVCVHLLLIRDGKVLGSRSYFPKVPVETQISELLRAFILQFYLDQGDKHQWTRQILVEHAVDEHRLVEQLLGDAAKSKITVRVPKTGAKMRLIRLAMTNASTALGSRLASRATLELRYQALEALLGFNKPIERMECFDISHTQGERTVASCVVFGRQGAVTSQYRRFNIDGITGGDDYAAMAQVLQRRYLEQENNEHLPQIIWIDGGLGQLHRAEITLSPWLDELPEPKPLLVGIAKGDGRKAGLETLILGLTHERFNLEMDSPALQLVIQIRDEAHRFAITGHRQRRAKARRASILEDIPGVGAKRRQSLLKYLGGMQEVKLATVEELTKVPGISPALAEKIYHALHH